MSAINLPPRLREQQFQLPDALTEDNSEFRLPTELREDDPEVRLPPSLVDDEEENEPEFPNVEASASTSNHSNGRTYRCPDCGMQVTRGLSGKEYGHHRGRNRCPRRESNVDPKRLPVSQYAP